VAFLFWSESFEPSSRQFAGSLEEVKETLFGIRDVFQVFSGRKVERDFAIRIACSPSYGLFIKKQPGLCHPDRDNSDVGWQVFSSSHDVLNGLFYLPDTHMVWFSFGISMDEQEIAGIEIYGYRNPLCKLMRTFGMSTQIRPFRLDSPARKVVF